MLIMMALGKAEDTASIKMALTGLTNEIIWNFSVTLSPLKTESLIACEAVGVISEWLFHVRQKTIYKSS